MNETSQDWAEPSPEEVAKQRRNNAKCGRVKRQLLRHNRLSGKVLDFALAVVGEESEIGEKLRAGQALTDYELHLMVDVYLLHYRLS